MPLYQGLLHRCGGPVRVSTSPAAVGGGGKIILSERALLVQRRPIFPQCPQVWVYYMIYEPDFLSLDVVFPPAPSRFYRRLDVLESALRSVQYDFPDATWKLGVFLQLTADSPEGNRKFLAIGA